MRPAVGPRLSVLAAVIVSGALLWVPGAWAGEKLGIHLRRLEKMRIGPDNLDEAGRHGYLKVRLKDGRPFVGVLLYGGEETGQALFDLGAENVHRYGPVYAAEVPQNRLRRLSGRAEVRSLRAVRRMQPTLDQSVTGSEGLALTRPALPPWSNAGAGVIFGLVDTGLDPDHGDFRTTDGAGSRILYLWDQVSGSDCTNSQIASGSCTLEDSDGHGTHVSGIAAGNGREDVKGGPDYVYVGVAPEADIIGVATTFQDADILAGVAEIFSRAHALGKPAVVNLSLGGDFGPHDGTDPFDVAMDVVSGPGQVIVSSAGNSGDPALPVHQYAESTGADVDMTFKFLDWDGYGYQGELGINLWHAPGDSYEVVLTSPTGAYTTCPVGGDEGGECSAVLDGITGVEIYNPGETELEYNGEKQIDVWLWNAAAAGVWHLTLAESSLGAETPHWMHSWIYYDTFYTTRLINGDNQYTVGSPGSARSVVTVGAHTTKTQWVDIDGHLQDPFQGGETVGEISSYSSRGPIRDGRIQPDVTAPGTVIGSAMTSEINTHNPNYLYRGYILEDEKHWIMMGTSMSSPHIAGLSVLLMGTDPGYTYTPAAVKSILAATADRGSPAGPGQNNTWGYGKAKADGAIFRAGLDSPGFAAASHLPSGAASGDTLVALGSGFHSASGAPKRYLYQWQRFNHTEEIFENLIGADYPRLEPQAVAANETVRVVVTPYEHAVGFSGYTGLLLGRSRTAQQVIGTGSSLRSHTGAEQWRMVSIPTAEDAAVQAGFVNTFWRWDESDQAYVALAETDPLQRGAGYWVWVEAGEGDLTSGGDEDHSDLVIELDYGGGDYPGRHLLGNPFNHPIYWENIYVSTDQASFTQRVTEAGTLVYNSYFADYDNAAGQYHYYDPADFEQRDGKIFPWEGFWVKVKTRVYLKITDAQTPPAGGGGFGDYPLPTASVPRPAASAETSPAGSTGQASQRSRGAWRIRISAESGPLRDDYNYVGVHPKSLLGCDSRDIPDAGTMSASHLLLYFDHDDWEQDSGRYCVDTRSSRGLRPHHWDLTAEARGLEEPVTMYWRKPPAGWELLLTDVVAGVEVDMSAVCSYAYEPIGDEDRAFRVYARKIK